MIWLSLTVTFSCFQQVLVAKHGGGEGEDDAAVDFWGNPVDKSKTGGWLAAGLILGV